MRVSGVRSWFVRDFIEVLERERGKAVAQAALGRLSARFPSLDATALRKSAPSEVIPIQEAEELFLGIDSSMGDGTGKVIEAIGLELFAKSLGQGGLIVPGDLMSTVLRLRAPLEYPFVDLRISFDLASSSTGFVLYLGVPRRPRSARVLRSLAIGAIRAAQRFCREGVGDDLRIFGETLGDRVDLDVRCRVRSEEEPLSPGVEAPLRSSPPKRATRTPPRPPQPTLDAVERILSQRRPSGEWPQPHSEPPIRRRSEPPRPASGLNRSEPPLSSTPPSPGIEPHTPTPVVVAPERKPSVPVRSQSGFTQAPQSDKDEPPSSKKVWLSLRTLPDPCTSRTPRARRRRSPARSRTREQRR